MSTCDCCCMVCVSQPEYAVVQSFGKHKEMLDAGCHFILYPIDQIYKTMSLKLQHVEISVSTKTKDNVGIECHLAIQYKVHVDDSNEGHSRSLYDAVYSLTNVRDQIQPFVEDVIRGTLPRMNVDEIFASRDEVSKGVKEQLNSLMIKFGYDIEAALITGLDLDNKVAKSMNEINASARMREAAKEKAEAEKILQVKAAEAEAEAKYLLGAGVAKQRKAIVDGLRETVTDFSEEVDGTTPKDVMDLLLMTQYFDTLKNMGAGGEGCSGTLFLPHGPHSIGDLRAQLSTFANMGKKGK